MQRKYVWIVTQCLDGKTAKVVQHCKTLDAARRIGSGLDGGNWEGPSPLDMYPIGKTFAIETEEA